MKLEAPQNNNYAATVVTIEKLVPLKADEQGKRLDCNNVVGTPLLGFQAIVSKDTKIGDRGIVFTAETQLSEEFVYENNLYRHTDKNKDDGKTGYLEDNRRVKAMKFRGHRSDCLFMPLESLKYTKINIDELKDGDTFDKIKGREICTKFLRKIPKSKLEKNKKDRQFVRIDKKYMPEHYDTDMYLKNIDSIPQDREVVVTQKLHGTSIRIAHTIVMRKLKFHEKIAKRLGVKVQDKEFDYVFGSRRSVKDINNPNQQHFYNSDIWTSEGKKLEGLIPENFILYAELIGWDPEGNPIQKNYTYQVPKGTCDLYVYRIAFINGQGKVNDLTWDQVREFCNDVGLKYVPELWRGKIADFNHEEWLDTRFYDELHGGYKHAVPLEGKDFVDEGVCIRVDGLTPYILKAKSPLFYQHESKMMDQGSRDLEAEGSGEV